LLFQFRPDGVRSGKFHNALSVLPKRSDRRLQHIIQARIQSLPKPSLVRCNNEVWTPALVRSNQRNLKRWELEGYAEKLGLDMVRFRSDLDQGTYKKVIEEDMALARELNARGTPTSFINGRILVGAQPFDRFKEKIDQALGR